VIVTNPTHYAVAEVLAWVYQLRRAKAGGDEVPRPPVDLRVPPDLDPEAETAAGNR